MSAVASLAEICAEVPLPEPSKRGVYILIHQGDIVYIGQSTNVLGRIGMHVSKFEFDRVLWIPASSSPERMAIEGALIRRFNPRHCRRCSKKYIKQDKEILARFGLEPDPVAAAESKRRNDECFPLAGRIRRQRDNCWRHAFKKAKRNGKSELAATRAANRAVRLLDERLAATTA